MKVCKYCRVDNPDSAQVCSSCGANDFEYKCNNCGALFDEGNFCPHCGVRAGMLPKKCPNCGTEYFSTACPSCGFIKNSQNMRTNAQVNYVVYKKEPVKNKSNLWLWVLGWIFLFPVPLSILIYRNKKLSKHVKIAIIAGIWALLFIVYLFGDKTGGQSTYDSKTNNNLSSSKINIAYYLKTDS